MAEILPEDFETEQERVIESDAEERIEMPYDVLATNRTLILYVGLDTPEDGDPNSLDSVNVDRIAMELSRCTSIPGYARYQLARRCVWARRLLDEMIGDDVPQTNGNDERGNRAQPFAIQSRLGQR